MNTKPIGIFDSGVGGITVFSEIIKKLPNEDIVYLGDTKQFPYGNKSKETIIELSKKNIEILIEKDVKAIIIACGTATSQALDETKDLYNIPIIGVIEPTVLDIAKDKSVKKIGVIATIGTIRSNSWEKEINRHIQNVEVINKECPLLAPMAEEGWIDNEIAKLTIREYVKTFEKQHVDKLILGCTHYPLFKNLIQKELGEEVDIIDVGKEVANYLNEILKELNIRNEEKREPTYKIYLTDTESRFLSVAKKFLNRDIEIKKL